MRVCGAALDSDALSTCEIEDVIEREVPLNYGDVRGNVVEGVAAETTGMYPACTTSSICRKRQRALDIRIVWTSSINSTKSYIVCINRPASTSRHLQREKENGLGGISAPQLVLIEQIQEEGVLNRCPNMTCAVGCVIDTVDIEGGGRKTVIKSIVAHTI